MEHRGSNNPILFLFNTKTISFTEISTNVLNFQPNYENIPVLFMWNSKITISHLLILMLRRYFHGNQGKQF